MQGTTQPFGTLHLIKIEKTPQRKLTWKELLYWSLPHPGLSKEVFRWRTKNAPRILNQLWRLGVMIRAGKLTGYPFVHGKLFLQKITGEHNHIVNYGLVSLRLVTDNGVADIVDEFDEATDDASLKLLNFHGIGTGVTGANQTDSDIETELTTEYIVDNTRATGAQSQPSAPVYQTLATNTLDSGTPAITEQGVLASATVGSGILLDRHTFAAINLVGASGDSLQSTYQLTVAAGG